mmetsp:Transcript_41593/g.96429  ORF Transcript_41593/g.96429 Transcript_41593/m.96429 type:complete len:402 (+) Transcript_41593:31-1236(+)
MIDGGAPRALVLGLNPALQRTLVLATALHVGSVHRANSVDERFGGKGQGVAAAIACLEPERPPTVVQLLGRDPSRAGERVEEFLREERIDMITGWFDGATRTCITIVSAPNLTTEMIEPSVDVPDEVVDDLLARTADALSTHAALVIAGTAPPGAEDFYSRLLAILVAREAAPSSSPHAAFSTPLVVLDGYKGIHPLLTTGRIDVLKINRAELLELAGAGSASGPAGAETPPAGEQGADAAADEAARRLLCPLGDVAELGGLGQTRRAHASAAGGTRPVDGSDGGVLAVTDGHRPAALYTMAADGKLRKWQLSVPRVNAVNAIGAGDVCTGVFSHKLACAGFGGSASPADAGAAGLCDAFAWGLAAASARCTYLRPDEVTVALTFRLRTHVSIHEVEVALK